MGRAVQRAARKFAALYREQRAAKVGKLIDRATEFYLELSPISAEDDPQVERNGYHETVDWARILHRDNPALQGLFWVSRRDNEGRAMLLFGDRIQKGTLAVQHGPIALRYFETEIDHIAARCDIDVSRR